MSREIVLLAAIAAVLVLVVWFFADHLVCHIEQDQYDRIAAGDFDPVVAQVTAGYVHRRARERRLLLGCLAVLSLVGTALLAVGLTALSALASI